MRLLYSSFFGAQNGLAKSIQAEMQAAPNRDTYDVNDPTNK
jgi:hypothetical protein